MKVKHVKKSVESTLKKDEEQAEILLDLVLKSRRSDKKDHKAANGEIFQPSSFRLGIAGPPGAGKSTLIEQLGLILTSKGIKVAVLAIGLFYFRLIFFFRDIF